jgi:hypothetical protein
VTVSAPDPTDEELLAAHVAGDREAFAELVRRHRVLGFGGTVAEAAPLLGVPEGTVKSRCHRGRGRLALTLGHLRNRTPGAGVQGHGGEA